MKKRILSLILTAAMLLTLVPVFATSAAAEETYTITYNYKFSSDGKKVEQKTATQEITGTGVVLAPQKTRITSSVYFYHWEGSDGKIYTVGQPITPTSDLTLTSKDSTGMLWNGYAYLYMATANYANGLVASGDYYLASAYSNNGLTTVVGGTAQSTPNQAWYRIGQSSQTKVPVFDYGTVARPGDGTNGVGLIGYEFSHYIMPTTLLAANKTPDLSAAFISGLTAENTIAVYPGDIVNTNGGSTNNAIKVTHTDGTTETTTATCPAGGGAVLIPVFKISNTSMKTTYNANFGDNATVEEPSLTVAENTFQNPGKTFQYWSTQPDGKGEAFLPGDSLLVNDMTLYAIWGEEGTVSAIYYNVDGEIEEIVNGTEVTAKTPEARLGYTFAGWLNDAKETVVAGDAITATARLNPQWTAITYKISFDANGGTTTLQNGYTVKFTATGMVEQGSASWIYVQNKWTRDGYIFNGFNNKADGTGTLTWGLDKANVNVINLATAEQLASFVGADFVMYAQWVKLDDIVITYKANGGEGTMDATTGVATALENAFTRKGYKFTGWKDSNGNNVAVGATITASTTLTAQWSAISYNITFDANNGTYSKTLNNVRISFTIQNGANGASNFNSADLFNPENWTREGYTFAGFNNQPDGKGAFTWGTDMAGKSMGAFISKAQAEGYIDAGVTTMYAIWVSDNPVDTEITLKEDATLVLGEEYVTGLTVGMTVEAFLAQFATEGLAVLNADGEAVTEGAMATGYSVVLVVNGEVVDSYIVVVYGDVDGDGIVNVNDIVAVRDYISGSKLDAANVAAANADRDEENLVNVNDIVAIRDHISGTEINQK